MGCEIDVASPRWLACNICGVTASRSDMHLVPHPRSCASAGSSVGAVAFWSNARAWLALFAAIRDLHVSKSAKSVQVCDGHGIVRADDKNHQKRPNHPGSGLNPSKRHSQFGPKCQSGLRAYAGPRSKIDPTQTNIPPRPDQQISLQGQCLEPPRWALVWRPAPRAKPPAKQSFWHPVQSETVLRPPLCEG
jgi:hypothetical protein